MTIHKCEKCRGSGWICPKCGKRHRKTHGWGYAGQRCYSRARPIRCPGVDGAPHFASWSECDVCALRVDGEVTGATSFNHEKPRPGLWYSNGRYVKGYVLLCPCCALRLYELEHTVFDRLVELRGQVNSGRFAGLVSLQVTR